jgi:hypothetical protein
MPIVKIAISGMHYRRLHEKRRVILAHFVNTLSGVIRMSRTCQAPAGDYTCYSPRLVAEGHRIVAKGYRYFVADFERAVVEPEL